MYKVPISVLKECIDNLKASKTHLESLLTIRNTSPILKRRLKRIKNNIKLLEDNYGI